MKSDRVTIVDVRPRFINERDLSMLSGLAVRTLQQWRLRGNLGPPWRKLGGAVRYELSAFQSWVNSQPGGGDQADCGATVEAQ